MYVTLHTLIAWYISAHRLQRNQVQFASSGYDPLMFDTASSRTTTSTQEKTTRASKEDVHHSQLLSHSLLACHPSAPILSG